MVVVVVVVGLCLVLGTGGAVGALLLLLAGAVLGAWRAPHRQVPGG